MTAIHGKCRGDKPELGCKDELGLCVIEIYSNGGDWVVYRNEKNVRVWTNEDNIQNAAIASGTLAQIGVDLAKVESNMYFLEERASETPDAGTPVGTCDAEAHKLQDSSRWDRQRQCVYSLVARSFTLRLLDQPEQATTVMKLTENMLSTLIWRANIGRYLVGAGSATFVFLLVAFLVHRWAWGDDLYSVFVFATLGGFLSVLSRIRSLRPALRGQHYLNILSGVIRIAIAAISGTLMYVAIKGGILSLFEPSSDAGWPFRLWFLLAVAGFFEKLVPDILGREAERRTEQ